MIFYFITYNPYWSKLTRPFINPSWSISPFIWVFVLVPLIDLALPYLSKQDPDLKENIFHNFSVLIVLPVLFLIVFGLFVVTDPTVSLLTAAALGAAVGMSGGSIGLQQHMNSFIVRINICVVLVSFY